MTERFSKDKELNLWDGLSVSFIVQRFFCIFPLERQGNKIVESLIAKIYTFTSLITYYSVLAFTFYTILNENTANQFKSVQGGDNFSKSYLIVVIGVFELTFNNVGIMFTVFFALIKRHKQILFLQKIYDIDLVILHELKMDINYKRLRLSIYIALLIIFSYYIGIMVIVLYKLTELKFLTFGKLMLATLYQFEQSTTAITTWTYISYVMLIRYRFQLITKRQEEIIKEKKIMTQNSIQFKENVPILSTLLMMYKELCSCIDTLNDLSGSILILRITHDFTLTTSQMYLISWIIMDNTDFDKYELVIAIFIWMFQNIVKMGLTTLLTEITVDEAKACSYTLNKANKNSDDEDIRCMIDSFDLWLLHRKIEFTANNFFSVDLSLLYAIVGALTSYVLILIQFKQQEETLTGDASGMANRTNLN